MNTVPTNEVIQSSIASSRRFADGTYDPSTVFQTVSDNYCGSIVITDSSQRIIYANRALLDMTGYALEEVLGKTPSMFKSGQTGPEVYAQLWETVNSGNIWRGEIVNRRKNGDCYVEYKMITSIRDEHGHDVFYFAIGEDLTRSSQYQAKIEHLMTVDELTGIANRSVFLSRLAQACGAALAVQREISVLHVDISDFLLIEEELGASATDEIITELVRRIRGALRDTDLLARVGLEKFAIMLGPHEVGARSEINEVAQRVLQLAHFVYHDEAREVEVNPMIGVASFPSHSNNANELLNHAQLATEQAKLAGGAGIGWYDVDSVENISQHRLIFRELGLALSANQLVLHYQPQVSLSSGNVLGFEALLRWRHPTRGMVPPGDFIPLVEHSPLIVAIGEWAISEACRQLRVWINAGVEPVKIAVNLAARHLLSPGLCEFILETLSRFRVPPNLLEVEVTESAMMHDVAAAVHVATRLKSLGLRMSLDDFGTGYSSLAYLSRFPIDVVKIDQSFVRDITHNLSSAAIAQATIAMSHKLGKLALAEGVETAEQMNYLRRNECDEIQGFLFSRPVPAEEATAILTQAHRLTLSGEEGPSRGYTVLIVDDEINILSSLKRTLRREGYDLLTANCAQEGFNLLATHQVHVVVSDQRMPDMSGTEFLSRVKGLYPQTVRMVLSGYADVGAITDAVNKGAIYRYLLKPWNDEEVKAEIQSALRHWREQFGRRSDDHPEAETDA